MTTLFHVPNGCIAFRNNVYPLNVDPARLMLLVIVLFDVAPKMIALPQCACFVYSFGKHDSRVSVDTFFGHFARPRYANAYRSRK